MFWFFTRDILITPTRLNYAREKERMLYDLLVELTFSKLDEIQRLISQSACDIQGQLADDAGTLEIPGIELNNDLTVKHTRDLKKCNSVIQEFVLQRLNESIANKLLDSINALHDYHVGTLQRCLNSLEASRDDDEAELSASKALQEV